MLKDKLREAKKHKEDDDIRPLGRDSLVSINFSSLQRMIDATFNDLVNRGLEKLDERKK